MNLTADQEIEKELLNQKIEKLDSSESVYNKYNFFSKASVEYVILVGMDVKNNIKFNCILSKGTINVSLVGIREIFVNVFKNDAKNIIILHNHPSGDPAPSKEDRMITKRLIEACKIMDIELLDHVIIGLDNYYSFGENGQIGK